MLVEMVRLQTQELMRWFVASTTDDRRHGDTRVVVADARRHAAEELERTNVTFLERLSAFGRKRLTEEGIAVRQRHHAELFAVATKKRCQTYMHTLPGVRDVNTKIP